MKQTNRLHIKSIKLVISLIISILLVFLASKSNFNQISLILNDQKSSSNCSKALCDTLKASSSNVEISTILNFILLFLYVITAKRRSFLFSKFNFIGLPSIPCCWNKKDRLHVSFVHGSLIAQVFHLCEMRYMRLYTQNLYEYFEFEAILQGILNIIMLGLSIK